MKLYDDVKNDDTLKNKRNSNLEVFTWWKTVNISQYMPQNTLNEDW